MTSNILQFKARQQSQSDPEHKRWIARIAYRADAGQKVEEYRFDELEDLHAIVEAGPNFYCIEGIAVMHNPDHMPGYRPTLEQAARE